jgi:hypothetical protein
VIIIYIVSSTRYRREIENTTLLFLRTGHFLGLFPIPARTRGHPWLYRPADHGIPGDREEIPILDARTKRSGAPESVPEAATAPVREG